MSHRMPPADRVPGLRFMAWTLGWMGAIWFLFFILTRMVS